MSEQEKHTQTQRQNTPSQIKINPITAAVAIVGFIVGLLTRLLGGVKKR